MIHRSLLHVASVWIGVSWLLPAMSWAVLLFHDGFDEVSLDTDKWIVRDNFTLARSEFRSDAPQLINGVARLRFDTFNPNAPGVTMLGAEILTRDDYSNTHGLSVEARIRVVDPIGRGLVAGFFGYVNDDPVLGVDQFDEIDVELLTNKIDGARNNVIPAQEVLTNSWVNASTGNEQFIGIPGLDVTEFNTYRFDWFGDRVEWFVNGLLIRTATQDVPDTAMPIRFNFWAPTSNFTPAFDASLTPVSDPAANDTFFYELDFVTIQDFEPIPEPLTAGLGCLGLVAVISSTAHRRQWIEDCANG